ncbi:MAG: NADH-quinone oxidoreductase subunit NuoF [Candidatus Dadabacteria bacterium]|nr:NADH-quinone oxidoreductase subunit NuoF [Candidatus Dadabacteria bacterium]NIS08409.1 NADH-quinone oxidoreductase subunit NuoF [Candidatus Dadabacteria bacterium]NIV41328.1 NADH-quinone oxidoreductase subunit NuoF [Candidatus Dadabacteria bacterium]NIY22398.1 NADH-quinone oxidoreductase subunit NuoF [Candidatus Dadabacteria bacterium]
MPELKIIRNYTERENSHTLQSYLSSGGYKALAQALKMQPEEVIDIIKKSGLRGRGGAGFPTGIKWGFIPKDTNKPVYLCCNADESEPGSFKDREIMEQDPHQMLEGIAIACYAIGSHKAYIYIRGEMPYAAKIITEAIEEANKKAYLGENINNSGYDIDIVLFRGAGAYICGEETALLESIEGKNGEPRPKPPFPAQIGLFGCPTIINNVETLAFVPHIINNGPEWFLEIGKPKNTGTKIYGLSGHVNKPGLYELPLGIPIGQLIDEYGGGIPGGRKVKAMSPGGSSSAILDASEIDMPMDFDSLAAAGSMLGTAGVTVMDDHTCMVRVAQNLAHFYRDESCGQCVQCREGTWWLEMMLSKIEAGKGSMEYIDTLLDACHQMRGTTICALADGCAMPVESIIKKFRDEFEEHITSGKCPFDNKYMGDWG